MAQLAASIALLYAVVGAAAIWYRRAKAARSENEPNERIESRSIPQKG